MQIDGSSARAGQDIVTLPRLRWSINFVQPTNDPATAGFSIAVDPASISEGMLVNGDPVERTDEQGNRSDGTQAVQSNSEAAMPPAREPATELSEAQAAAEDAAGTGSEADQSPSGRQPSDEDLYAPHPN